MRQEIRRIREPIREETGIETEPIRERMLERLSKGEERRFSKMYIMLPKNEREKIKNGIKFSDKFSQEKKGELLPLLEEQDREAVRWWKITKDFFGDMTEEELKKWEKRMKISKRKVEAAKKAADEMTEEELKRKELPPEERLKLLVKEISLRDPGPLKGIVRRLKEAGITKGPEQKILEEIEWELDKIEGTEKFMHSGERRLPLFLVDDKGELVRREGPQIEIPPPERDFIRYYKKWIFTKDNLGKSAREETVDEMALSHIRYKEAMEEVRRERR